MEKSVNSEDNSLTEESENEMEKRKKILINLLDEEIKQKKENFLNLPKLLQKKEEIQRLSQNLKLDIKNLEQIISGLLDRQKDDYLDAFSQFMDSIKKNLTVQLEEIEKAFEEKRKTNDIRIIRCERDFFKSEAIRLNNLVKKFKVELEKINFNYKLTKIELTNVKMKYKETENINKQLLSELENNSQNNKKNYHTINTNIDSTFDKKLKQKLKKLNKSTNIMHTDINNISKNTKKMKNESNIYTETIQQEKKTLNVSVSQDINCLNNLLIKSKNETKKVKEKANKAIAELSKKYLEKNKLENIFENCVEETKKIIFNRKMKENKIYKIKNNKSLFKPDNDHRLNFTAKFEEFLPSDKQKTLEKFIFDDEVYKVLKDIIFNRTKTKIKSNSKSSLTNTLHFSGTEYKLKKINDIPSIPSIKYIKKNFAVLPLMHTNKLSLINLKNEDSNKNRAITVDK